MWNLWQLSGDRFPQTCAKHCRTVWSSCPLLHQTIRHTPLSLNICGEAILWIQEVCPHHFISTVCQVQGRDEHSKRLSQIPQLTPDWPPCWVRRHDLTGERLGDDLGGGFVSRVEVRAHLFNLNVFFSFFPWIFINRLSI